MANSINSTYCNANVCVFVVGNVVVVYTGIEGKKKRLSLSSQVIRSKFRTK